MKVFHLAMATMMGLVVSAAAWADASAFLTLNQQTLALTASGSNLQDPLLDRYTVTLAPGESRDFTFQYAVTLSDQGLPVPHPEGRLAADVFGCVPLTVRVCGPDDTGFEAAKVYFDVAYRDPRAANPFISVSADGPTSFILQTAADSFADLVQRSGTIHLHIGNTSAFGQSDNFLAFGFGWVLAVPEPATWALLLGALPMLLAWRRR